MTAAILLAGGSGSRFGGDTPKQFVSLKGKPLCLHSLDILLAMPEISEIVVVCAPEYRFHFPKHLSFALPGERRQDSVYNGLTALKSQPEYVCIHDAARPFITQSLVKAALDSAEEHGAATIGMPLKFTVKEHQDHFVTATPDRATLFEIQTPQVIRTTLLQEGFAFAHQHNLTVTDDVSLVELLGKPVKLVTGSYTNIKVTTPEDFLLAECLSIA